MKSCLSTDCQERVSPSQGKDWVWRCGGENRPLGNWSLDCNVSRAPAGLRCTWRPTNEEKLSRWSHHSRKLKRRSLLQATMCNKHSWAQVIVSRGVSKRLAQRETDSEPSSKPWPACCHVIPVHFVPKHSSRLLLCHCGNKPQGWHTYQCLFSARISHCW